MVLRCVRASRARELCYEIIHFNNIKNFFLLLNTLRKSGLQSHNLATLQSHNLAFLLLPLRKSGIQSYSLQ